MLRNAVIAAGIFPAMIKRMICAAHHAKYAIVVHS
jgi:hypothetical protein